MRGAGFATVGLVGLLTLSMVGCRGKNSVDGRLPPGISERKGIAPPIRTETDHREVDLGFRSRDTDLNGTLFLPKTVGRYPAVVWVHASGKHDRLQYGNIVRALTAANIALFSYDKRGSGKSGGKCCPADNKSAGLKEFGEQADDALAALEAVRPHPEIDGEHIGFLGVSQAGWIVPVAATRLDDVKFAVLVSAPAVPAPSGFDPKPYIGQMTVPGLWLFGSADAQIPAAASKAVIDQLKAAGKDFTTVMFEGAGHGLLDVTPPPPPEVVPTIVDWITAHTR